MAVSNYIGWPTKCNKVILDSTTITLGENATKTDELENGHKLSRLRSGFNPEKYSVVMEFEWSEEDEYGKSELQYFYEWYKYKHKYGTIPFEFPKILYSPNTGVKVYDDENQIYHHQVEWYKITSAVECSKSGTKVQVKMTWSTVYGGVISIQDIPHTFRNIDAHNGYVDVIFSSMGNETPTSSDFVLKVDDVEVSQTGNFFDGTNVFRIYFEQILSSGTHSLKVKYSHTTSAGEVYTFTATDSFTTE